MNHWYELEIQVLDTQEKANFYKDEYDRSDSNAGVDLFSSDNVHVEQTPQFIPFGIIARMLKVQRDVRGTSNDYLKTDSHFWLMPRSSIYKSGLMMANSTGLIDKSSKTFWAANNADQKPKISVKLEESKLMNAVLIQEPIFMGE